MKRIFVLLCLTAICSHALADSVPQETRNKIQQKIDNFAPGLTVNSVNFAPIDGFYEVSIGTRIVYFSQDGRYMFLGELFNADSKENLTEQRRAVLTAELLQQYGSDQMIVIGPEQPKRYITVFTDVDCPYCARFHRDVPELNEAGVQVRYLLFPRTGLEGRSYQRAVGVWCAEDRIASVGIAKAGGEVEYKQCDNPVKQHYALGQEVGINGTPAIILDDGRMIAGYVAPKRLFDQLGIDPAH